MDGVLHVDLGRATALELPRAGLGLQEAALNPCVTLFVDRARAARTDFHLHAGNQEAIVDLVGLLEGMPLAIELAAARVRSLSPAEMAAMLRRARGGADGDEPAALDLLERRGPRAGHDTRHASMQQVIEWSWKLLSTDQARLLCALTALRGSFDAALVRDLCRGLIRQPLLRLDELAGHSLLRAAERGSSS